MHKTVCQPPSSWTRWGAHSAPQRCWSEEGREKGEGGKRGNRQREDGKTEEEEGGEGERDNIPYRYFDLFHFQAWI